MTTVDRAVMLVMLVEHLLLLDLFLLDDDDDDTVPNSRFISMVLFDINRSVQYYTRDARLGSLTPCLLLDRRGAR